MLIWSFQSVFCLTLTFVKTYWCSASYRSLFFLSMHRINGVDSWHFVSGTIVNGASIKCASLFFFWKVTDTFDVMTTIIWRDRFERYSTIPTPLLGGFCWTFLVWTQPWTCLLVLCEPLLGPCSLAELSSLSPLYTLAGSSTKDRHHSSRYCLLTKRCV